MNIQALKKAVERGGSIRAAARELGVSYTSVQWWLARNGYRVVKVAKLVRTRKK
ncbi:MAG TPA: hypothetical protein PLD47_05640 [Aggregatilineales bacterium]|nr:helix-turn-helix domain-containing protein [Anaerolineales bacterium]HRE47189.1 hypothetical protein [Aggregatilineales bacterium]